MTIELTDFSQVDLDRHGVIEASAGTGKTFAIESLVLRLLTETPVALDQILLVTFTEKATSELKARLRQKIEATLAQDSSSQPNLRAALENFDAAAIFTIHGFCQRVLKQHAFENGEAFDLEVIDDAPLYKRLLRRQQRRDWPALYADDLPRILALSNYPDQAGNESAWEANVLEIARRFRPVGGDQLAPAPEQTLDLGAAQRTLRGTLDDILPQLGQIDPDDPANSDFYRYYAALPVSSSTRSARLRHVVAPLLALVAAHAKSACEPADFALLLEHCDNCKLFDEHGFAVLEQGLGSSAQPADKLAAVCRQLETLRRQLDIPRMQNLLAAKTIARLKDDVAAHKEEHGLIGYDDMLSLVDRALAPQRGGGMNPFLASLRQRFRYALVDEFQDTDPVQWRIFRRIFLGSPEHRLFVIGDPKQAIYSFRGADIYTYRRAREEMLHQHQAASYTLPVNWRSVPALVEPLNRLFGAGHWFPPPSEFQPVRAQEDDELRQWRLDHDAAGRAAVTLVDLLQSQQKAKDAQRAMARFVAREIARLLAPGQPASLLFRHSAAQRALVASDICVLVRRALDAALVEEALRATGVPFSYYKKQGLYQSREALHLLFLFRAIARPGDAQAVRKALLTSFFAVPLDKIADYRELAAEHPIRQLFRRWDEWRARRDWVQLFNSIRRDTGLIFRQADQPEGDRALTNYRHLLQDLQQHAIDRNLDFQGILDHLQNCHTRAVSLSEESNLHRLETERPKVQIMTVHSCKGLEFPVVFLAGGFTGRRDDPYWRFHDANDNLVYDLTRAPAGRQRHLQEADEEEQRLYYVALTRAVFKLYLPYFRPQRMSSAGPVGRFVFDSIETAWPDDRAAANIARVDESGQDLSGESPEPAGPLPKMPEPTAPAITLPDPLIPDVRFAFGDRLVAQSSFTALSHHAAPSAGQAGIASGLTEVQAVREDEPGPGLSAYLEEDAPAAAATAELPRGPRVGSMLHAILEQIDFDEVAAARRPEALLASRAAAGAMMATHLQTTGLAASALEPCALIVYNALCTPLNNNGLRLCDRGRKDRIHELEFYFPLDVPEQDAPDGFLMGFIDLVFRHDNRYYLADFKSNYLADGYAPAELARNMREANYILQLQLYAIAMCRWLRRTLPDFSFEKNFGGAYYLYLRGLDGQDPEHGVFFHRATNEDEITADEQRLRELFVSRRAKIEEGLA